MAHVSSSGTDRVVGRGNELSRLDAFMDDLAQGPTVLLLEGESGIGKTTLWKRGVATATERDWRVLSTRPAESEAKLSYAGLADLLDASRDVLQALPDPQRHALEVALLKAEPEEGASDARAVSAALLTALREAAAAGSVLIALDDVQWLDPSTASALGFAVRRLENEPIGLLLARREAGASLPFGLSRAFPEERIARVRLEPLSVDDLGAMLHARLGANLPRPTLKRLHEMSRGNPFFALEIARAELRGELRPTGAALPIPQALREDLLRDRLRALPSANRETLLYASACSRPTVGLLEAVTKSSNVAEQLTKAMDAGIVETDGHDLSFTHPLYGSAIYAASSRDHRHRVHRRLAEVVEDPEERARHLALAADGPDPEAAKALEDAARAAIARGSPIAAAELCEMAVRLTPSEQVHDIHRLRIAAADYWLLAGDQNRALQLIEAVAATAPSGPERAEALRSLGLVLFSMDEDHRAADIFAEARREEAAPPGALEWGLGERTSIFIADYVEALTELGMLDQAGEVLNWLEERGQVVDRPWSVAVSARYRGLLAAVDGDFQAAFASLDRALKEHERLPMPFELGRTMLVLGAIRRRAKQKRPAREALEEALAIFERLGAPLWVDKTRAELARIGGRRSAAGQLTEVEARVAKLAAAGRTNREIADALFMSVRTVEGHLSHVYAKLGVRSRTELVPLFD